MIGGARCSAGTVSSSSVPSITMPLRLSSCSRAQARRLGAESSPFDVAACHHKHGAGWESRESDWAGFKFNLCRDGNERVLSLGKRAFLSPSDTRFRSGRAPGKDLSMRPLFLKIQFWLVSEEFYGFLWAWTTGFMTSPFVSFNSKRTQKPS